MGRIAAKLGKPLMPHQQHVLDVALEIDPATERLWYREVGLALPRQNGKTTLLLPKFVWRAESAHLLGGRQRMLYAAQTKKDAVEKFEEDFIEDLAASRVMAGRFRVTNSQGRKQVRFRSGSLLIPVATTARAGHGKTLDDGTLDEAWSQVDNRVEAAWRPAMITRANAQLWETSTAGDRSSLYWRSKVDRGRRLVEEFDPTSRHCWFEWSASARSDPFDPAVWWATMPALGLTIGEDAIRHELTGIEGGVREFARAYLNMWPDDVDDEQWELPKPNWVNCADPRSVRAGRPVLAVDVSPNRSSSAVSMAAAREDGLPMGRCVRHGRGTAWVPGEVGDLVGAKDVALVVLDGVGPVSSLRGKIEKVVDGRCLVRVMNTTEVADACADMFDAVVTEQLRHAGQEAVDDAVAGLAKRALPGGRWAWDRRHSTADITPIVSMTNAVWGLGQVREVEAMVEFR